LPAIEATFSAQADADDPGTVHVALDSLAGADPALEPIQASARIDTGRPAITVHARDIAASLFTGLAQHYVNGLTKAQLSGTLDAVELTLETGQPVRAAIAFNRIGVTSPRFAAGPVRGHYYRNGDTTILSIYNAVCDVRVSPLMP